MNEYTHILVALDLSDDSQQIMNRAQALAQANNARLSIVHVLEPLGYAYGGDIPMDLTEVQQQLDTHARKQLHDIAARIGINPDNTHVLIGRPETEVHRFAEE